MTHDEAVERLKELANGAFCSVQYETFCHSGGNRVYEIAAYIADKRIVRGKTYAQVIAGMEAQLGIGYQEPPEVEDDES